MDFFTVEELSNAREEYLQENTSDVFNKLTPLMQHNNSCKDANKVMVPGEENKRRLELFISEADLITEEELELLG